MLTEKDKIEQFKREMRSIRYYEGRMQEINDELVKLNRIMREPKPIKYGEAMGNPPNFYDLMEQEDTLRAEYEELHGRQSAVYEKLSLIPNEKDKDALIALYIHRERFEEVADKYFRGLRSMKRDVDKIISEIV